MCKMVTIFAIFGMVFAINAGAASESALPTPIGLSEDFPKFFEGKQVVQLDGHPTNTVTLVAEGGSVYISLEVELMDKSVLPIRGFHLHEGARQLLSLNMSPNSPAMISKITFYGVSSDGPGTKGRIHIFNGDLTNGENQGRDDFHVIRIN